MNLDKGSSEKFQTTPCLWFLAGEHEGRRCSDSLLQAYLFILWKMMGCSGARVSWRGSVSIANIQTLNA